MRTRYLLAAGAAVLLTAAVGTGIALAGTSTAVPAPGAVPAAVQTVDTPEPGDTPDPQTGSGRQGADVPEPGDTPDAPGQG